MWDVLNPNIRSSGQKGSGIQTRPSPVAQRMPPGGSSHLAAWPSSGYTFPRHVTYMVLTAPALVDSEHLWLLYPVTMESCPGDAPHISSAPVEITLIGQLRSHVCCIGRAAGDPFVLRGWGGSAVPQAGPHASGQEPYNHSHIFRKGNKWLGNISMCSGPGKIFKGKQRRLME